MALETSLRPTSNATVYAESLRRWHIANWTLVDPDPALYTSETWRRLGLVVIRSLFKKTWETEHNKKILKCELP